MTQGGQSEQWTDREFVVMLLEWQRVAEENAAQGVETTELPVRVDMLLATLRELQQARRRLPLLERLAAAVHDAIGHAEVLRGLKELRPWYFTVGDGDYDALLEMNQYHTRAWHDAEQRIRAAAAALAGLAAGDGDGEERV